MRHIITLFSLLTTCYAFSSSAETVYTPAKAVYDVTANNKSELNHLLDRAALLQRIYNNDPMDASIILVIHESAIKSFSKNNRDNRELIQRADDLSAGDIIHFRLCSASAKIQGYSKDDFPAFIRPVPMADAEIIKLQNLGYGYLK